MRKTPEELLYNPRPFHLSLSIFYAYFTQEQGGGFSILSIGRRRSLLSVNYYNHIGFAIYLLWIKIVDKPYDRQEKALAKMREEGFFKTKEQE